MNQLTSVIISTYNNYDSLLKSIKSVLEQTEKNIELLIIDCDSSDERYKNGELEKTYNIVHLTDLTHPYESVYTHSRIRKEALQRVKGEWLAFLDADDYWYPNKIEQQRIELEKNPNVYLATCNFDTGTEIYHSKVNCTPYFNYKLPPLIYAHSFVHTNYIHYSSVVLHRTIAEKLNDSDSWTEILTYTPCLYHSDPLLYIRRCMTDVNS